MWGQPPSAVRRAKLDRLNTNAAPPNSAWAGVQPRSDKRMHPTAPAVGNLPGTLNQPRRGERNEINGAIEGTRTPTPLRVHGPEPCASANSATMASGLSLQRRPKSRRIRKTTSLSYNAAPICQNRFSSSLTLAGQPVVVGMPRPSFVIRSRTIRFVKHVEHFRQLFAIVWRPQPDHHFRQMRVVQTVVRHAQESCARVLKLFRP